MPFDISKQKTKQGLVRKTKPKDKLTNRELREKTLISLARKFKPEVPKALKKMVWLLSVKDSPGVRMNAAKFILEFYGQVAQSLYLEKYDADTGKEIQPIFVVHDINAGTETEVEETKTDQEEFVSTNRTLRERQLLMLVRRLRPHVKLALETVSELCNDNNAPHAVQLAAAKFLLLHSDILTKSIYKEKYDEEGKETNQDETPVYSLTMQRKVA